MTLNYKFIKDFTGENTCILRLTDNKYIPFCDGNIDYQEYLEWAKTNTTEEAD